MICSAKPVLTEDLYVVQKKEFSIRCYKCDTHEGSSIFIRDKPAFSSERIYIRTITTNVKLKKSLVVGLKGLDAKTN
jgi:hypothetical protein